MKTLVWLCVLSAVGAPLAHADETSKAAKMAELMQLIGERQFLHEVDGKLDQEAAVRAWGRAYSENVTEAELDAILAYYRSPAGQKDVSASRAALAQAKKKNAAIPAAAGTPVASPPAARQTSAPPSGDVGSTSAAGRTAAADVESTSAERRATSANVGSTSTDRHTAASDVESTSAKGRTAAGDVGSTSTEPHAAAGDVGSTAAVRRAPTAPPAAEGPWDSAPRAPDGLIVPSPSSPERCEASPTSSAKRASGRSIVCVCTDEKGALTRDPIIAESSGDPRVDSGAIKMARIDSGRYTPPTLNGQPQNACFRFAIDFSHHQ